MPFLNFTGLNLTGALTVEPKMAGPAYSVAELGKVVSPYTAFAFSGASDGTNIAVGAYSAYKALIYSYNGSTWTPTAEFTQSSGRFGYKVALDGDWLAVATTPASGNGSVFMYRRVSGTWNTTYIKEIVVPGSAVGTGFAASVALSGTTLVVGHRQSASGTGGAYVFVFDGTNWVQQGGFITYTTGTRASNNQNFGADVSIDGNTMVVGGPGSTTTSGMGMAFVSKRTGSTWSAPVALVPVTTYADGFGYSVKVRGTRIVVGAPNGNTAAGIPGRAFLYDATTSTPVLEKTFTVKLDKSEIIQDTGMTTADLLGWSVDINAEYDHLIVSAVSRNGQRGAIYIYEKFNNVWGTSAVPGSKIIPADVAASNRFGSIAMFAQGGIIGGAFGAKAFYWFK